jgi:hypothetical protein
MDSAANFRHLDQINRERMDSATDFRQPVQIASHWNQQQIFVTWIRSIVNRRDQM